MNFQKFIQQKKKKKEKEKKIEYQSFEEAKFQRKNLTAKCLRFQNTRNKVQWKILLLRYIIIKDFKLNALLHASL